MTATFGQNEFTNPKFYDAFKKINADADGNFTLYKGIKIKNELAGIVDDYEVKLMLPGAGSGSISTTFIGNWYAVYYFTGGPTKEAAEAKKKDIIQAVANALNKTLYHTEETSTVKDLTLYTTYYSATFKEPTVLLADFKTSIYFDKGKYVVSFQVNGKGKSVQAEKKSKLAAESNLDGKITDMWNDATNCFNSYRANMKSTDQYVTEYNTTQTLFGLNGVAEDWKLECTLKYTFAFTELSGLDEANYIYAQLKASLAKVTSGKINFLQEEQSKYNENSYSVTGMDIGKNSLQTRNYITLTINREKDYPAVYLVFKKTK